ncbi:MAG: energy-coupling factor ABC transporter permease [Gammaproteobacteria bacterium]|nr:energy-coupling factor ABC transporter permease [Gammaproteobacteria bacterium]
MLATVKVEVSPGLGFHHLGATLFTLMFGWPLTMLGLAAILLASVLLQHNEIIAIGVNGCLSIAVPVFMSYSVLRSSEKILPDNYL